jgi:hypothetical protein
MRRSASVYKFFKRRLTSQGNMTIVSGHEFCLLLMAIVICVYKSIVTTLWTYYIPETKLIYGIFFCMTTLESGYHPYLYVALNR